MQYCLYTSTPKFKLLYSLNYPGFLTGDNNVGRSVYIYIYIYIYSKVALCLF